MEQIKFGLMQIALEIYKIEVQKGNQTSNFMQIYNILKNEMGVEQFTNKDLGVDIKNPDRRDMDKVDTESYNMRVK